MEQIAKNLKSFAINHWIAIIAVLFFLILTAPALLDKDHFLYNLEPYPDGIAYSLSAKNLVDNGSLRLENNFFSINLWFPPLYSYVLAIGYLLNNNIATFYATNLILNIGTILLIYSILKRTVNKNWITASAIALYLSHLVIFWIPMTPMSENLLIFLFVLLVRSLVEKHTNKRFILGAISIIGLFFTKFSMIITTIIASILLIYPYIKNQKTFFKASVIILFVLGLGFIKLLINRGLNIEYIIINLFTQRDDSFFSILYLTDNLDQYFKSFIFQQGKYLWLKLGVSSIGILLLYLYSLIRLFKTKKDLFLISISLFISQFPLLLIFYSVDSRYLIFSIPLMAISIAWSLEDIKLEKVKKILIILLAIGLNLILQKNLLREIVSYNILGNSTAWQYVASQKISEKLNNGDFLITALPPFLVDSYKTKDIRVLPLSEKQEFINRNQFVWGNDLNYQNLIETYDQMLGKGASIYISNAYITHQHEVVLDYEEYKKLYNLKLIYEGCYNSCNLYLLQVK